jgi:3-dehydroquinate synthase
MPDGEREKSPARANRIHAKMLAAGIPRQAALIALGGGVVGDIGGFVASTYRRGIMFVQCPTTLLSQVDSSVGGKNGVNHPASKNTVGTFWQPTFVLSDVGILSTLPRREVVSGLGEILKYAFVGDPDILQAVEHNLRRILQKEPDSIMELAERCLRIKTALVSGDERELLSDKGRAFLNVGHAVGHALEALSSYRLRHGEAVFLGLMVEGCISVRRSWMPTSALRQLEGIYNGVRARFSLRGIGDRSIIRFLLSKGKSRFVLPRVPGMPVVVQDVSEKELLDAVASARSFLDRSRQRT